VKVISQVLVLVALLGSALSARAEGVRRFGLMIDAGVPDGANASLVFRPLGWLRVHAGGGTNLVSPGIRAGVSILPLSFISLNVDGGHYFNGDANKLARTISGDPTIDVPALRDISYDYANFHVGLELGGSVMQFYIHGGMSYLAGSVKNLGPTLNQSLDSEGMVTVSEDPRIRAWAVSARVGLIFYIIP